MAFTLIELLVVVGVIAILMSLLLPALNSARDTARDIKCKGNCRSVMQRLTNYTDDYGMLVNGAPYYGATRVYWYAFLSYLGYWPGNRPDIVCPTASKYYPSTVKPYVGLNCADAYDSDLDRDSRQWRNHSRKILVGDAGSGDPTCLGVYYRWYFVTPLTAPVDTTSSSPGLDARHNNKANLGFLDGHVDSINYNLHLAQEYEPASWRLRY